MAIKVYSPIDFEDTSSGLSIDGDFAVDTSTFFVDVSTDRVGVGTSSPAYKLHVTGDAILAGASKLYLRDSLTYITESSGLILDSGHSTRATKFLIGGSEKLRIHTDGNIGIGTTSPSQKIHITASGTNPYVRINESAFTGIDIGQETGNGNGIINLRDNADLRVFTNATERMRITSSGNVGIGTSSPSGLLSLSKGTRTLDIKLETTPASGDVGVQLRAGGGDYLGLAAGGGSSVGLVVDSSNKVGIGTTSPSTDLEIGDSSGNAAITINKSTSGTGTLYFDNAGSNKVYLQADSGEHLRIATNNTERIRVTDGGNVLIGTTTDSGYKLSVNGTARFYGALDSSSTLIARSTIQINNGRLFELYGNTSGFTIRDGSAAQDRLRIDTSGRVGIGTTSPNHKVDIYSNENVPLRIHRPSNANLNSSGAWGIGFSTRGDALTSTSDTRAGIFSYYNGNLFIATSTSDVVADPDASARLTVASGGNVGIGTTSPSAKLHIEGDGSIIRLQNNNSDTNGTFIDFRDSTGTRTGYVGTTGTSDDMFFITQGAKPIRFYTNNSERMRLESDGDVGIGTSSPAQKLHVSGRTRVDQNSQAFDLVGTDHVYSAWYPRGTSGGRKAYMGYAGASTTNFTAMNQDSGAFIIGTNDAERMRIISSGNVGIGTTSPDQLLHVSGNTKTTNLYVAGDIIHDGDADTKIQFNTDIINFDTAGVERLRITAGGDIGVGTASPDSALHVEQDKVTLNTTNLDNGTAVGLHLTYPDTDLSGGEGIALAMGMNGRGRSYIANLSASTNKDASDMLFYTETGGVISEQMRINSSGNVGIGTTSPSQKLTVAGNITQTSNSNYIATRKIIGRDGNGLDLTDDSGGNGILIKDGGNVIINAGNLGVGTSSPNHLLDVESTGASARIYNLTSNGNTDVYLTTTGTTGASRLLFGDDADNDIGRIIYRNNGNSMAFETNAAEAMRINSSGDVGIGTTGPAYKLDVDGDIQINETLIAKSGADLILQARSSQVVGINSNGTRTMTLDASNNVGIGTTSPGEKLDVAGNIQASGSRFIRAEYDSNHYMQLESNSSGGILKGLDGGTTTVLVRSYGDSYFNGGDFGIGTTSPSNKLHVVGDFFLKGSDTSSSTKNFQVQTGDGTSIMDFRNDAYAFFGCGQGGGDASGFIFRYNSTFGVQFTGYNYGNGSSPSYKPILMDTDLAGRSQGVYINYGITGYTAPAPTSNTEFAVRGRGTSSNYTAKFEDSSTNPLLYIKDNGNVTVGTATDSGYKLDVEGNTNTNGDYHVNGNQGWSGTITIPVNPPIDITVEGGIITNVT